MDIVSTDNYLKHFFVADDPLFKLLGTAIALAVVLIIHFAVVYIFKKLHPRRGSVLIKAIAYQLPWPTRLLLTAITLTASIPLLRLQPDPQ